jgi:glucan phosphoethanolaminetransferase (alkaline phosphatase superfamily)
MKNKEGGFMVQFISIVLGCSVGIALIFHFYSVSKIKTALRETNGVIMSMSDLEIIKEVINLNMKLAVYYIVFFVLLIIFLGILFLNKFFKEAVVILFLFGVITLIIGLWGKIYENKIRNMEVKTDNPEIREAFQRYLKEWAEPRWQLSS